MPKIIKIRFTSTLFTLSVILLLLIGITAIYSTTYSSASNSVLYKQLQWVLLGLIAATTIALVPTDFLSKYSKYMLAAVLVPLAYLTIASLCILCLSKATGAQPSSLSKFFPFVVYNNGAARWLHLAGFTMQPSEFAKFTIILFLATYYGTRDTIKIESFKEGFLIPALASAVVMALVFLGKSLSNTIILASIVGIIMFVSGVRMRYLITSCFIAFLLVIVAVFSSGYRRQRIINFVYKNKSEEVMTTGKKKADNHQLKRAICALGSGGLTGLGIGRGRLKNQYIPESSTDFIFAVIGEEFGFLGILFAIILYLSFMVLSFIIATQTNNRRGVLIAITVGFFIPFQAMYNLSVVCGLMPTTGVTAPLVSYGGSSIISMMLCIGLVLNVCHGNYIATMNENQPDSTQPQEALA